MCKVTLKSRFELYKSCNEVFYRLNVKFARGDSAMPVRVFVKGTEWRAVNSFPVKGKALSNSQIHW